MRMPVSLHARQHGAPAAARSLRRACGGRAGRWPGRAARHSSSAASACASGRGAQLAVEAAAASAPSSEQPDGSASSRKRVEHHVVGEAAPRQCPGGRSASSADFTSQAIFGRAGVFEQRLAAAPAACRGTARASPGCPRQADACPAATRPRRRRAIATATGAPAGIAASHAATASAVFERAGSPARACPRPAPVRAAGCGTPAPCRPASAARHVRLLRAHRLDAKTRWGRRSRASPGACSCGCARALFCRLSRYVLRSTSAARSMAASTEPKRSIRSRAPLSPMPGAPGMLSMASPLSASRSATCARRARP